MSLTVFRKYVNSVLRHGWLDVRKLAVLSRFTAGLFGHHALSNFTTFLCFPGLQSSVDAENFAKITHSRLIVSVYKGDDECQ